MVDAETQKRVFIDQIHISRDFDLPLVVHSRQAEQDTIDILRNHCDRNQNIHLHCFTDSINMAHEMLTIFPNLYIGFTGVITFDTADHNRKLVGMVPLNRMLLETDSPFMAPVPYRGNRSHSGYIPLIAECVSKTKRLDDVELVLPTTYENTVKAYKLSF